MRTPLPPHRSRSMAWPPSLHTCASSARHDVRSRTRSEGEDEVVAFHNVVAFSSHPRKFLQENKEQGHSSERSNVLKPAVYPCWTLIRLVPPYGSVSDAPRRKDARDCGGRDAPAADRCAAAGERWDRAFGVASLGHAGDGRGCAIPGGGGESAAPSRGRRGGPRADTGGGRVALGDRADTRVASCGRASAR